jgi:hypothetical protein
LLGLDPDSIRSAGPDSDSGFGIRIWIKDKNDPQKQEKVKKFQVLGLDVFFEG